MKWQKGQSGNQKGRPKKGGCISDILQDLLAEKKNGTTRLRRLIEVYLKKAEDGDIDAFKALRSYIQPEPRAAQLIELNDPEPIRAIIRGGDAEPS